MRSIQAILLICLLAFSACGGEVERISKLEANKENIYCGPDRELAKKTLESYVSEVPASRVEIEKDGGYKYNILMADAWLKLASIYEVEGRMKEEELAIGHAIDFFDRDESFARDPKYNTLDRSQKGAALRDMLRQVELHHMPEWKKRINTGAGR
jgi:hypothetical protein